jgi:gluconokinase
VLVVVMGVAGVGKTTVGRIVASRLGVPFYDGDDFQPEPNRRKMAAGVPLSEEDREPWLEELARLIPGWEAAGGAVLACSALRRRYRRTLREAAGDDAAFIFLATDPETIRARLETRPRHYMPASLLDSQLETLEPPDDEEAVTVRADGAPDEIADEIVAAI